MIYMRNITITTAKSATYLENVGLGIGQTVYESVMRPRPRFIPAMAANKHGHDG
jgi:hypothetical protein